MGRLYLEYLEGNNIYTCSTCSLHLTSYNELISKVIIFKFDCLFNLVNLHIHFLYIKDFLFDVFRIN